MSANVTLTELSWSAPDGTQLLSDLNLGFGPERSGLVGRNGVGKTTLLRLIAGELRPSSGHVRISGKLGLVRQDLQASPSATVADLFGAGAALAVLDRAATGGADADELARADWTLPARIESSLARCRLAVSLGTPLAALSGGQRTRASLAALIFSEPDFLLLDEPTNNLDADGRRAVAELVRGWRGGAIVISHDRALVEEMDAIVELTTLGATRYGGGYTDFLARKATEIEALHRGVADAEKARAETARRARQAAERKARSDSSGRKSRSKGGQAAILMDAAKERAEASAGALGRLREARRDAAEQALSAARSRIEVMQPLRMDMPSTGLPPGRTVLRLDAVTGGHDPARPVIRDLSLTLAGPERVAITGPNGSGKSTLLSLITGQLEPQRGTIDLSVAFALLDQHVGLLDPGLTLRENFLRLAPHAGDNDAYAALARFRFRAADALQLAGSLSGGERLRAGLACTMGQPEPPGLLILDEATNHLDLDGLEALEAALAEYDGALLVVSHDESFLESLALDRRVEL